MYRSLLSMGRIGELGSIKAALILMRLTAWFIGNCIFRQVCQVKKSLFYFLSSAVAAKAQLRKGYRFTKVVATTAVEPHWVAETAQDSHSAILGQLRFIQITWQSWETSNQQRNQADVWKHDRYSQTACCNFANFKL